ncbi:protein 33K [Crane-associated adenovirus 1]|uniref:Protein 33K n=1 Tax=Crane-associated adenovirus 1 TaxID=2559941 RepID=A0A5H2X2P7_9ADEN|nr:protein 33K [Crane-associated adenovirus 1]
MAQKMIDEKKINQNDSEDEESIGSQDSFHSMDSVESVPSPELQKKTFQTMKTDSNTLPKPKERSTRALFLETIIKSLFLLLSSVTIRANYLLLFLVLMKPSKIEETPDILHLRSEILSILIDIDRIARHFPSKKIAIRNRTRESITRHLHYQRDLEKLLRMKTDAINLLALWQTAN